MNEFQSAWGQFVLLRSIRQAKTFLYLVLFASFPALAPATAVWIDTDVAIGSPFREVDDAFAILLAARSRNLAIAGISTSYGNASLETSNAAAHDLIQRIKPGPLSHVYSGARSRDDLGRETSATTALAAALRKEHLTYLALGPLTNLATFQLRHPDLARRIKRIIFVGGTSPETDLHFGTGFRVQIHDANVLKDPAAVRQVLAGKTPITLLPVERTSQLILTGRDLDAIERSDEPGHYVATRSRFWLWFWTTVLGTEGGPIFDAAAILAVADPNQLSLEKRLATVDAAGNLIVSKASRPGAHAVAYGVGLSRGASRFVAEKLRGSQPP